MFTDDMANFTFLNINVIKLKKKNTLTIFFPSINIIHTHNIFLQQYFPGLKFKTVSPQIKLYFKLL